MATLSDKARDKLVEKIKGGFNKAPKATKKNTPREPEPPLFDDAQGHQGLEGITAGKGKKLLSKLCEEAGLTDITVVGLDPYVTKFDRKDWDKVMQKDIPVVDKDYIVNWEAFAAMAVGLENKEKPLIVGKPGTGKTTMVKLFAALTNHPYMRINGKDGLEPSSFLGTPWATDGGMEWKDGAVTTAVKNGYLLAYDEPFKAGAGVNMAFQWLYEDDGKLFLDDKPGDMSDKLVHAHDHFGMVLCDNVKGLGDNIDKFAATTVQDSASLDRFGIAIELDYLTNDQEKLLLKKWFPQVTDNITKKIVQLATLVRAGYNNNEIELSMSPRSIKKFAKYSLIYKDTRSAFLYTFANKLADENELVAVSKFYKTVFNEELTK